MPLMPPRNSIQRYLLISILTIISTGWLFSTVLTFLEAQEQVEEIFDAELAQMSRILQAMLLAGHSSEQALSSNIQYLDQSILTQHFDDDDEYNEFGHEYERKIAFQAWRQDGRLILANNQPLPKDFSALKQGYQDLESDGRSWRSFTLIDPKGGLIIRVAHRGDVRSELTEEIAASAALPGLLLIALLIVISALAIRRGLKPLRQISSQLKGRDYNNLDPLTLGNLPKELQLLIDELNRLFSRVSESYVREKRFTADAAHELRTPLSITKVHLQNVWEVSKDPLVREYLAKALQGIERLIHLVQQLLLLSRLETSEQNATKSKIDLAAKIEEILEEISSLPANDSDTITKDLATGVTLQINDAELHALLRNLIDNALRYRYPETGISITLSPSSLRISNQVDTAIEEPTELLFERFRRGAEKSRTGSGLGLAICRQICELNQLSLRLTNDSEDGKPVVVTTLSWASSIQ